MVLCLIATREWFIPFCIPPKDLGDPGSSRGTLERVRVDLTVYTPHTGSRQPGIHITHTGSKQLGITRHTPHKYRQQAARYTPHTYRQ